MCSLVACANVNTLSIKNPNVSKNDKNMTVCSEGQVRRGYKSPTVRGEETCETETQTCISDQWSGTILYDSCENLTKFCGTFPNGSVISGYVQINTPRGVPCVQATKTCVNGQWLGPEVFENCTELP